MFDPKYSYTDKLVTNLIKIENQKTQLQTIDLSYDVRHKLALQNKTLDMFHLAHMIGLELTLKDAEKLATGMKLETLTDDRANMLANFRNALEFSRSNVSDTYAEVDFTILLHLNKLILTSWRETWEARFRNISDTVDEKWDNWIGLRDQNINNAEIEREVAELVEWYKNASPTLTPVIRIGVLIYRLLEIYPFVAGNKMTIIAISDYLLLKHGLSSKVFTSVVRNFDINAQKYIESIFLSKTNVNLNAWLEAFTAAVNKDLLEARENINSYIQEDEKAKNQPFLDLNKRQLKVLRYLQAVPMIKREDYCHMMEVSTMTAFRDLNDLVRKKLLKVDGQGRGTKYRLSSM